MAGQFLCYSQRLTWDLINSNVSRVIIANASLKMYIFSTTHKTCSFSVSHENKYSQRHTWVRKSSFKYNLRYPINILGIEL